MMLVSRIRLLLASRFNENGRLYNSVHIIEEMDKEIIAADSISAAIKNPHALSSVSADRR
jgi:sulfur transfer complex TusBCD TusB component (DsrH family)